MVPPPDSDMSGRSKDSTLTFLEGGGELGALIRQKDWAQTPLGDAANWPQSLRSAVSICLGSGFPIAIYWGPDLALLYNDAWSPIPGAKHPWALGHAAREVWPEIWDTVGPLFQHVMTTGEATRSTDQLLAMRRHGYAEECYFDYTFSPVRGESGRVEGIFNAVLETTGRVIGERRGRLVRELAGRVSEARTVALACRIAAEALSSSSADVPFALLYLVSADGSEALLSGTAGVESGTHASPASIPLPAPGDAAQGWPVEQVVRMGVAEFVDDVEIRFGSLSGGPWPESAGSAFVLPLSRAGGDRPYGALVAGLSPRREFDCDYRGFLEIVAGHIAQALANAEAYEEERKRAEALAEINRAKTAFFSNVSHEFRTPLTLMLGPIEQLLAMDGALPRAATELLSVAHRNSLRLQKLVNTLLDFSRLEAGRAQASYEAVDLAALTTDLASTFRSTVEKAGLRLIVECPPLPYPVYVDREMWEKIVLNLLSNAFKYTFEGRISVRLSAWNDFVRLSVEDTGTGIPELELPRVFERFHRVEGSRGRTQEGTGIGLALVAELVKLQGGAVEVKSAVGQGSTFTVSLPIRHGQGSSKRAGARASALGANSYLEEASRWLPDQQAAATTAGTESGGRILLADDNADMRDYVARLLKEHYDVEAVANGEEALARVLENPPDLVLSDVMMPGLDGIGFLKTLRAKPETTTLPVILLSARAGAEASEDGLAAGATDYLVKPFTARELLARVAAHMEMTRVRKQGVMREAELRAEAERARDQSVGILESIKDAFATFDSEWRIVYVNAETERLVGMRRDELLGKRHWDIFPATRGTVVEQEYSRAIRDQVPVEFDYFHEPWGRWFSLKGYPTQESGISIYFRDITEQKNAAAQLLESQERLRAIYDGTYEYIGLLAPDGTLLEANRASLEFAGNTREDVIGQPFWDTPWFAATPGVPEAVRDGVARAASGEFVRFEAALRRPSGEMLDFDISFHPVKNERGEVVLIVPEGRNITERKRAQARLEQQWHAFDTVLSNTPDLLYTYDREARFTYMNRALIDLSQRPAEERLGKSVFEVGYPPELAARLYGQIQQVIRTRQPLRDSTPVTSPSGNTREYEYILVPVLGSNGEAEGVAGSTRDVTDQKRAEERERERQAQLRESARLESLGVMAGGIAHDFNNLLVGILGNASLLAETSRGSNLEMAEEIVLAAERAAELTKQMLAYSGKGHFVIEVLDLNSLIQENLTLLRSSLSRSVSVELELGCEACFVEGDRTQLHQVIMNLLINASEAVGNAPGKVDIRTSLIERKDPRVSSHLHMVVPPGGYALLEVRDSGAGMTPETLRKIFDPFFTTKFIGRGLGLAAVLGIVKGHKGDIDVETEVGHGTTFRIFLPTSKLGETLRREPEPAIAVRSEGQTVLVVDDEDIVLKTATAALQSRGFHVIQATNGAEALDILRATSDISLIILDLTMPVMTGEQALMLIRARYPKIPVLLSSGFSEAEISRRFASSGIAGVLQKPYTVSVVLAKVVGAIDLTEPRP